MWRRSALWHSHPLHQHGASCEHLTRQSPQHPATACHECVNPLLTPLPRVARQQLFIPAHHHATQRKHSHKQPLQPPLPPCHMARRWRRSNPLIADRRRGGGRPSTASRPCRVTLSATLAASQTGSPHPTPATGMRDFAVATWIRRQTELLPLMAAMGSCGRRMSGRYPMRWRQLRARHRCWRLPPVGRPDWDDACAVAGVPVKALRRSWLLCRHQQMQASVAARQRSRASPAE